MEGEISETVANGLVRRPERNKTEKLKTRNTGKKNMGGSMGLECKFADICVSCQFPPGNIY